MVLYISKLLTYWTGNVDFPFLTTDAEMFETPGLLNCYLHGCKKRRKDNRLILLYKGLKGKARIPTDELIPKTRRGRNQNSLAFQIPSASKVIYQYSFFPEIYRFKSPKPVIYLAQ